MRKICFVNPFYVKNTIGGAEVQLYLLAKKFYEAGWDVYYATEDIDTDCIDEGIKLVKIESHPISPLLNFKNFKNALEKINADVYYQRGRKEYTCLLNKFTRKKNKIFVFSNSMEIDANKYKFSLRRRKSNYLSTLMRFFPLVILDFCSLRSMKSADIVLTQTIEIQNMFKDHLSLDSTIIKKIYDVPNEESVKQKTEKIVLWVGNIKAWKQPEVFLSLVDELHTYNWKFVMIGEVKEDKYQVMIDDYQKKYNNFQYLGRIDYLDVIAYFNKASIYVNTSINESEPNTYIESWLSKVPVVALNHDADNVITEHRIGFHSGNFSNLVRDVECLIKDDVLRTDMGDRGREYAKEVFSDTQFIRLIDLIEAKMRCQ